MEKIKFNISLIDFENVSILNEDIDTLKITLNHLINNIVIRQNLNIGKSPFEFGLWFESCDCYNILLKKSILELKRNDIEFFNPMTFSNSILNSLTSSIAREFNIRGYSNSFIKVDFLSILADFIESGIKYGFIINITKKNKKRACFNISIILIMKSTGILECIQVIKKNLNKEFENFNIMVYNSKNLKIKQKKGNNNLKKFDFPFFNIYSIISMYFINRYNKNEKTAFLWRDHKYIRIYII